MKVRLLASLCLVAFTLCAQAQTVSTHGAQTETAVLPPTAGATLERAIASYRGVARISLRIDVGINGKTRNVSTIRFAKPDKLIEEQTIGEHRQRLLFTDNNLYIMNGHSYQKIPNPPQRDSSLLAGITPAASSLLAALLDGKNPITSQQHENESLPHFQGKIVALLPRVINGEVLQGVQSTSSYDFTGRDLQRHRVRRQTTAWFGGAPFLLRRVQTISWRDNRSTVITEKITAQQLNPTFPVDTFQFNAAGLKLFVPQEPHESELSQDWDTRLKTNAPPFDFQVKGINGSIISPAKYKGKVLLLDFWATWCGPCVAGLPELKNAYNKYHSRGLEVVGISLDDDRSTLSTFIKNNSMPWPQVFDSKAWSGAVPSIYGVKAIPFMLIIGKNGRIAAINPRGRINEAVKSAITKN